MAGTSALRQKNALPRDAHGGRGRGPSSRVGILDLRPALRGGGRSDGRGERLAGDGVRGSPVLHLHGRGALPRPRPVRTFVSVRPLRGAAPPDGVSDLSAGLRGADAGRVSSVWVARRAASMGRRVGNVLVRGRRRFWEGPSLLVVVSTSSIQ
mmetsp:Transcript_26170/g.60164  ORF Transcript_26170/g.60164 Transcript_26170/m.60164 type:complete len:153 (-) Transcript_26170:735-1193(-)